MASLQQVESGSTIHCSVPPIKAEPEPEPNAIDSQSRPAKGYVESKPLSSSSAYYQVVSCFREHTRAHGLYITIAFLATVVLSASPVIETAIMSSAQNEVAQERRHESLSLTMTRPYCMIFMAVGVIICAAGFFSTYAIERVTQDILCRTRVLSLRALLAQSLKWHDENWYIGTTFFTDTTLLGDLANIIIELTVGATISFVTGPAVAHMIAWKLALVSITHLSTLSWTQNKLLTTGGPYQMLLPTLPLAATGGALCSKLLGPYYARHFEAFRHSVNIAKSAVAALRHIMLFGLEDEILQSLTHSLDSSHVVLMRKVMCANFYLAISMSLPLLVNGLAYWWGLRQVFSGQYSVTQLFLTIPTLASGAHGLSKLMLLPHKIGEVSSAAVRISDLVALLPRQQKHWTPNEQLHQADPASKTFLASEAISTPDDLSRKKAAVAIDIRSVRFSYPSRPMSDVIRDLTIRIPGGSFCALVGKCGSGKSTILSLVKGLYSPSQGRIVVDGIDVDAEDGEWHSTRRAMSLVPQVNAVFDAPVAFNISIGSDPTAESSQLSQLERAARSAGIHDVIQAPPSGYQTYCGTGGKRFSGGERQKLCIARALVRDAKILLLDEPTKGLDSEAEAQWQTQLLHTINKQRKVTVVVAAHRLHTVQHADIIFIIDQGRCIDQGTHRELLVRNAWYHKNVLQQKLNEQ